MPERGMFFTFAAMSFSDWNGVDISSSVKKVGHANARL